MEGKLIRVMFFSSLSEHRTSFVSFSFGHQFCQVIIIRRLNFVSMKSISSIASQDSSQSPIFLEKLM
ncbi:hypothetical protein Peur_051799 [Populus x canadensis]